LLVILVLLVRIFYILRFFSQFFVYVFCVQPGWREKDDENAKSGGNDFIDFPDNQPMTKFRVFIG